MAKLRNPWVSEGQAPFGPMTCKKTTNWTRKCLNMSLSKIYNSKRGGNGDSVFEWGVQQIHLHIPKLRNPWVSEDQGPLGP